MPTIDSLGHPNAGALTAALNSWETAVAAMAEQHREFTSIKRRTAPSQRSRWLADTFAALRNSLDQIVPRTKVPSARGTATSSMYQIPDGRQFTMTQENGTVTFAFFVAGRFTSNAAEADSPDDGERQA